MKLIREVVEQVAFLTEEKDGVKKLYLEGPFLQGGIGNKNKRIYRVETLEREANRYLAEKIQNNCAYGELGHPATPNINLDRVAIHIKGLRREGNDFIGKALVASTPMGDIVRGLHSDGAKLGVSSRGLGSLKTNKEGLDEVQDDYRLATPADVVAEPSAPDAYVQGLMENREYIYDAVSDTISEIIVDTHRSFVKKASVQEIEAKKFRMFEQFINGLVKK